MYMSHTRNVTNLIETVLTTITDVDDLDDLRTQTRVEHVTLTELSLEVCATSQDKTGDIDLVGGNKVLHG